jgi:hypothetical protein
MLRGRKIHKNKGAGGAAPQCLEGLVELSGIEPLTSAVRLQRSPI